MSQNILMVTSFVLLGSTCRGLIWYVSCLVQEIPNANARDDNGISAQKNLIDPFALFRDEAEWSVY